MKKTIWWILVLIILGLGGFGVVSFWQRDYLGWERFTIIRSEGEEIVVESVDSDYGTSVRLPKDLVIETNNGRGEWRVGALKDLGKKYGTKWEMNSVADALGIFYTTPAVRMKPFDQFRWWWKSRNISFKQIVLADSLYVDEQVMADGVKVWKLNQAWTKKTASLFASSVILSDEIDVEVVNTTDGAGLGNHVANMLTGAGVRVIRVGEQETLVQDKCVLVASKSEAKGFVTRFVRKYMDCRMVYGEDDEKIEILVGQKYLEEWKGN